MQTTMNENDRMQLVGKIMQPTSKESNDVAQQEPMNATGVAIVCPIDGKPCDPACPNRYIDQPGGGCVLSTVADMSDTVIIVEQLEKE